MFTACINTLIVNGHTASLDGAIIAEVHIFLQADVKQFSIVGNSSRDIAIPMDANGTAEVCLDNIPLVICQAEAAALFSVSDTAPHLPLQLFRIFPYIYFYLNINIKGDLFIYLIKRDFKIT